MSASGKGRAPNAISWITPRTLQPFWPSGAAYKVVRDYFFSPRSGIVLRPMGVWYPL